MGMGKYVACLRAKLNVSSLMLCRGLCSDSQLRNYEDGNRELDIYIENRLLERLGCSTDTLQFMMKNEPYTCWEKRMEILYAIMTRNLEKAMQKLCRFEEKYGKESLQKQYALRMRSFIAIMDGRDSAEITELLRSALQCTLLEYEEGAYRYQLLSPQEVDMIIDLMNYGGVQDCSEIYEVINYIRHGCFDLTQKSYMFPKAVLLYWGVMKKNKSVDSYSDSELRQIYEDTTEALYYLQEKKYAVGMKGILRLRQEVLERIQRLDSNTQKSLFINHKWLEAYEQMTNHVGSENSSGINFRLYMIRNVDSICDVLTNCMERMNISTVKMADAIEVDPRTIRSIKGIIEKNGERRMRRNPQEETARRMLSYMGLPTGYVRQAFFVQSPKEKCLMDELLKAELYGDKEVARKILEELEKDLDADLQFNLREIRWHKLWLAYYSEEISQEEYLKKIRLIIEECFSLQKLYEKGVQYLSYAEIQYLCSYAQGLDDNDNEIMCLVKVFEEFCYVKMGTFQELNYYPVLHLLLKKVQSVYRNRENYMKANKICNDMIQLANRMQDLYGMETFLVAQWKIIKKKETKIADGEMLSWLEAIADLAKDFRGLKHLQEKKD